MRLRTYKYLGFIVTPSGEINTGLNDLKDRALRAIYKVKMKLGPYFNKFIKTSLKLFDTLIAPILLYASDFWGCLKLPANNPIENTHMRFLKQMLGVQNQTPNVGVLLEAGRVPMHLRGTKQCIKNWHRIAKLKLANNLTTISYNNALKNSLQWPTSIKTTLSKTGQMDLFLNNENHRKPPSVLFFERGRDIFHQEAFAKIQKEDSKLRTFAKLKNEIGLEDYLLKIANIENRIALTKLRLSNHKLEIEVGRHKNIPKEKRFCPFCLQKVEDEIHFMLECTCYTHLRNTTWEGLIGDLPEFRHLATQDKFRYVITREDSFEEVAKFIKLGFELRSFLVEHPKRAN